MKYFILFLYTFFCFINLHSITIEKDNTVVHYCQLEKENSQWIGTTDYTNTLHKLIDVMDKEMYEYLKIAKVFKIFISPIVAHWAHCRKINPEKSELVKWSKSESFHKENMYKNTDSFEKLENLLREISLFMMDLSIQSDTIRKQCIKCCQNSHRYVRECLLETETAKFKLPGFSMIEKLQILNSERVIAILTITGNLLYGS